MLLVFAILLIIILVVLVRCIVIVPQSNAYVTEWLGVYKDTDVKKLNPTSTKEEN